LTDLRFCAKIKARTDHPTQINYIEKEKVCLTVVQFVVAIVTKKGTM
jgi:hypothetical protein